MNLTNNMNGHWPAWWRLAVIASAVFILCSCRAVPNGAPIQPLVNEGVVVRGQDAMPLKPGYVPLAERDVSVVVQSQDVAPSQLYMPTPLPPQMQNSLPPSAWTGAPPCPACIPGPQQQWSPPGIAGPWPRDEYLCDGGDGTIRSRVSADWQINGLAIEDTIAHYDTLDGRTVVEPSNRVCIYAPRFGSVRRVSGLAAHDIKEGLVLYNVPTKPVIEERDLAANTTLQRFQTERQIGAAGIRAQQRNTPGITIDNETALMLTENKEWPIEEFTNLQNDVVEQTDEPWLAADVASAIAWTHDKGVEVAIDARGAHLLHGDARAQATFTVDHKGNPKLRIIKTASTDTASPGEIVEFTLRFKNLGDELIGNVTIVDNLTTRLEYLPDSQTCTLPADFLHEPNDGDSLVLRWEIINPLPIGEEGVIKFKCRVR